MQGKPKTAIIDAAWSRDGEQIFYLRFYRGRTAYTRTIVVRDLKTGKEKELSRDASAFALSPDGQQLAFHSDKVLQVMPAAGGKPREVLRGTASEWFPGGVGPAWTPDGHHIIVRKGESLYPDDPEASERQLYEVWRVPVEGGEPEKLGLAMKPFHELSIHPDGRQIAFTQPGARRGSEVWAMENFLPGFTP